MLLSNIKTTNQRKYHGHTCREKTLAIDDLFSKYEEDKDTILKLMDQDPQLLIDLLWKDIGSPLAIDNQCRLKMGSGDPSSPFACVQCQNMRRLIDLRKARYSKNPIIMLPIECGKNIGHKLRIIESDLMNPSLSWHNEKCIIGDSFTIEIIITWKIAEIFRKNGMPHIPHIYTAFICGNKGYRIDNLTDSTKLNMIFQNNPDVPDNTFNSTVIRAIILQLLVIFTELKRINFSHEDISNSMIFKPDYVSYSYNGVPIQGPVTLQITNLDKASISHNEILYCTEEVELVLGIFSPPIVTQYVFSEENNNSTLFYKLTSSTINSYKRLQKSQNNRYLGSYNIYSCIIGLMKDPIFFNNMKNDEKLKNLWEVMWLSVEECNQVEAKLNEDVDQIIKGIWLRNDIIPFLWNILK